LSLPVDYDSLTQAGSIMDSGGMIVMDERTCMVDVAEKKVKNHKTKQKKGKR